MKKPPFLLVGLCFLILMLMAWWGLAFLPLPDAAPKWMDQARLVCFDISENGLPKKYGWIILLGAPALILSFLWMLWGYEYGEMKQYLKETPRASRLFYLLVLLFIFEASFIAKKIITTVNLGSTGQTQAEALSDLTAYPRLHQAAPPLHLHDEQGRQVSLAAEQGKVVYIAFSYAHCKGICPMLAETLKKVHLAVGADKTNVFMISLDPWRDTLSALAAIHQQWNLPPTMHVLSGTVDEVNQVLDAFNVPRSRDDKTGEVVHPPLVEVIAPEGQVAYIFNGASTELLIKAGRELLKPANKAQ